MKLAFMGFRHGHIMALYEIARRHPGVTIVGVCEEDPATAARLRAAGQVQLTHDNYDRMLAETSCDAIAIGDYFARRGELILRALAAGKHVLADKPICTRISELDAIQHMAAEKSLHVGCMLDMRISGIMKGLRQLIAQGRIGEVQTVNFTAQHPLLLSTRPAWYFEPGKHGGVLNDIAVHALDLIEWATGRRITEVVAARAWNLGRTPIHFQEAGQMMLRLDNGGGVLGDVSYLAPDKCGYQVPQYWRVVVHGNEGVAEAQGKTLAVATHSSAAMEPVECPPDEPAGILESFLAETAGRGATAGPSTAETLRAARLALLIQEAADANRTHADLPG
jgi:predicted dehydrogenase